MVGNTRWRQFKLEDVCDKITDGKHGDCQDEVQSGYYFLSAKSVKDGRLLYETGREITQEDFDETHKRTQLEPGDILFTNTGTIGRMAIAPDHELTSRTTFQKSVAILKPTRSKIVPLFLYYILKYDNKRLSEFAHGTTQKNLLLKDFRAFPIDVPQLSEQRVIAQIFGSLDDKIELNRRMNETLEQMAAAIFKAWFVDFEPVKAKADGAKSFPSMPQEVFDTLPTEFTDSPLGPIPKEWSATTIKEQYSLVMGQSPKSEYYNEQGNGLPFHQGVRAFGERFPTHDMHCTVANRLAESGDILFSVRAPVGRINIADRKLIVGRGLAAIRHCNNAQSFLLYALKHQFHVEDSIGTGTIFASVTKKDMENIQILNPPIECLQAFEEIARSFDQRYAANVRESVTLAEIRDSLLPKLLSGEIRVGEAETIVEEVA